MPNFMYFLTKRVASVVLLAVLASTSAVAKQDFSELQKIGEGKLNYMFWDIYTAELYAAEKPFSFDRKYALNIRYERDISQKRLLKTTAKELRKQQIASDQQIETWMKKLSSIWQDVAEGDELSFVVESSQKSTFTLNGKTLGTFDDPQFAKAFASIWLGEKSSKPDLRDDLLQH